MLSCGNARGTLTETWQLGRWIIPSSLSSHDTSGRAKKEKKKVDMKEIRKERHQGIGRKTKKVRTVMLVETRLCWQHVWWYCILQYVMFSRTAAVFPPLSFPHSPYFFFPKSLAWLSHLLSTNLLICQRLRQHLETRIQEYKRSTS